MAFAKRSSRLAVVEETTEGTAVAPSASSDYVPLRADFSITPQVDTIETDELRGSIGQSKKFLGNENPTASIPVYLKHSGTEGVAPRIGKLFKSLFGQETVRATERSTIAGSTAGTSSARAVIKVGVGIGANFARGNFLLNKDPVNGYSIRPVYSVSGDDLSLGFNLAAAPGASVPLGKDVLYSPADTGHKSFSFWDYRANGGAVALATGMQALAFSFEGSANELLEGSFDFQGLGYILDPIVIGATDTKLDFTDDAGTFAATIAQGVYHPHELAAAIQAAIDAVTTTTPTVTYDDTTGKFTIKTSGTLLSLLWNTGANTANTIGDKIGFNTAADSTGTAATTGYTSANAFSTLQSPQTPSFDSSDPLIVRSHEFLLGSFSDYLNVKDGVPSISGEINVEKSPVPDATATQGRSSFIARSRNGSIELVTTLSKYEAKKFKNFKDGDTVSFLYNFGKKSGGNWIPGQCGGLYLPDATITEIEIADLDDVVTVQFKIEPHVDSNSNGEIYLGFV